MLAVFISSLQMDKKSQHTIEGDLRDRLGDFLRFLEQQWPKVGEVFEIIKQKKWPSVICGGAVRELVLGRKTLPRDLDVIIGCIDIENIMEAFDSFPHKRTRMGGITLCLDPWNIDIWPLNETWAIRNNRSRFKPTFQDYTKTTFLNIDAVAVQLYVKPGEKRRIYSSCFFDGIINHTIEVNLEDNPNPLGCIVKSLVLSKRYHFKIGPRLAHFIVTHMQENKINEVKRIYKEKYYGKELREQDFSIFLNQIKNNLCKSDYKSINLFGSTRYRQLEFKF